MVIKTGLYPHQEAAAEKLLHIRVGALFMEMGTGKTRTALEMICRRLEAGKIDHVLWLCPCSVRQNLKDDIRKHADGALASIAIYGIESLSSSINLFELLTRYCSSRRTMLIVDESSLIKNPKAIRSERITQLGEFCPYRLILNGTPISRNEADLFAQFYLLDWRILGYRSYYSFAANHLEYDPVVRGKVRRVLNTDYLVEKIAPYTYQAFSADCVKLPGKKHKKVQCEMTVEQNQHYNEIMDIMISELDEQKPSTVYRMFSAAQSIISGMWVDLEDKKHMKTSPMFENPLDNPRIQCLIEEVEDILKDDKILIFCKYTHEIKDIVNILEGSEPFYGEMTQRQRNEALERFRGSTRILVANKVCAGYGLNLQHCHHVIFYTNDWDYATREQAEDRVWRIGQDHEVDIVDIVCEWSLDNKIMDCLDKKEGLSNCIKRELNQSNDIKKARGKYLEWLRGNLVEESNGKTVH